MESSEFQSTGVLLDQIDSALSLWGDGISVTDTKEESQLKLSSFKEMYDAYEDDKLSELFNEEKISPDLTFGESVLKSNILGDKKLLEAIFFSKIFENGLEFDSNRADCAGKLVWVKNKETLCLYLISRNQIVYWLWTYEIEAIRSKAQKLWGDLFKQKVRNNLVEAVQIPASQDWNKYVSDLQSSFGAAPSSAVSDANPKYPLTEELKMIFLDELNSLQLDPIIKQEFVFDLKVMPDKDIAYWRERLTRLRFLSTAASCQELQRLSQAVADLEKLVREKSAETSTLAVTLPKLKEIITDQVSDRTNEIKASAEKVQQLVDFMVSLAKTFEGNETSLAKISDQLSATIKTDLKQIISDSIRELRPATDLMESTNCAAKISRSSIECTLNEMQAKIHRVELGIINVMCIIPTPNVGENGRILSSLNKSVYELRKNFKVLKEYLRN